MNWKNRRKFILFSSLRITAEGFTLLELLLAMTISSLLVMCILSATRAISGSRDRVEKRSQRLLEARNGLESIVAALRNVRRDSVSPDHAILGHNGEGNDRINLLVVSDKAARMGEEESDQYEMTFYLWKPSGRNLPLLMCRKDPAMDDHPEEGGVATVVAEGIVGLMFEYYTGEQWQNEWTELENRRPKAVRVTLAAMAGEREEVNRQSNEKPVVLSTIVAIHSSRGIMQSADTIEKNGGGQGGANQ